MAVCLEEIHRAVLGEGEVGGGGILGIGRH